MLTILYGAVVTGMLLLAMFLAGDLRPVPVLAAVALGTLAALTHEWTVRHGR